MRYHSLVVKDDKLEGLNVTSRSLDDNEIIKKWKNMDIKRKEKKNEPAHKI